MAPCLPSLYWFYTTSYREQASTLTQNDTGPVGPVTPSIYWFLQNFYWSYIFSLTYNKKEHWINFTTTLIFINFNFIYFKNIWGHSRGGNFLTRMSPNVYWACRTSWSLFLLARNCFWEFLLAWGHRFTLSVEPWRNNGDLRSSRKKDSRKIMGLKQPLCLCKKSIYLVHTPHNMILIKN